MFFLSFFKKGLFIYFTFWRWVFVAAGGLSLVVVSRGRGMGWEGATLPPGSGVSLCFSCYGTQALGGQASAVAVHGVSSCNSQA